MSDENEMGLGRPVEFTDTDALELVSEAEACLARARDAILKGEFVHADGWIEAAKEALADQDVTSSLAADERIAAKRRDSELRAE
jgi:hypothetical protein